MIISNNDDKRYMTISNNDNDDNAVKMTCVCEWILEIEKE